MYHPRELGAGAAGLHLHLLGLKFLEVPSEAGGRQRPRCVHWGAGERELAWGQECCRSLWKQHLEAGRGVRGQLVLPD